MIPTIVEEVKKNQLIRKIVSNVKKNGELKPPGTLDEKDLFVQKLLDSYLRQKKTDRSISDQNQNQVGSSDISMKQSAVSRQRQRYHKNFQGRRSLMHPKLGALTSKNIKK